MKKKHYKLLRLTLHSLIGKNELSKILSLIFKKKCGNVYGIIELLKELDTLFLNKLLFHLSDNKFTKKKCLKKFEGFSNIKLQRKFKRKNPRSI